MPRASGRDASSACPAHRTPLPVHPQPRRCSNSRTPLPVHPQPRRYSYIRTHAARTPTTAAMFLHPNPVARTPRTTAMFEPELPREIRLATRAVEQSGTVAACEAFCARVQQRAAQAFGGFAVVAVGVGAGILYFRFCECVHRRGSRAKAANLTDRSDAKRDRCRHANVRSVRISTIPPHRPKELRKCAANRHRVPLICEGTTNRRVPFDQDWLATGVRRWLRLSTPTSGRWLRSGT